MTDHLLEEQHLTAPQPPDEQGATQETKEVLVAQADRSKRRNGIVICYDASDEPLLAHLDPYLQLLYRRLGSQIERHYFCYQTIQEPEPYVGTSDYLRKSYEEKKAKYEELLHTYQARHRCMIRFLEQYNVLFVACISNAFMTHLWADMQEHRHLASLFSHEHVQIAKVLIRPTSGENTAGEPLCAYEGVALEQACGQVTAMLETIAEQFFGPTKAEEAVTPFTLLASPTTMQVTLPSRSQEIVAEILGTLPAIVEQTQIRLLEHAQRAETAHTQRRALEERTQSERAAMQQQLDQMQHCITHMQQERQLSLLARLARLCKRGKQNSLPQAVKPETSA